MAHVSETLSKTDGDSEADCVDAPWVIEHSVSGGTGAKHAANDYSVVLVDNNLVEHLRKERGAYARSRPWKMAPRAGQAFCLLCPCKFFRRANAARDFQAHLEKQHSKQLVRKSGKSQQGWFIACQVKWQLQVVRALYDDDQITRSQPGNYLQRSANVLWGACKGDANLEADMGHHQVGYIFKVHTPAGIEFMHRAILARHLTRRIGFVHMTKEAMEATAKELVLNQGRLMPTRRRVMFHSKDCGNRLWGSCPIKICGGRA